MGTPIKYDEPVTPNTTNPSEPVVPQPIDTPGETPTAQIPDDNDVTLDEELEPDYSI